MDARQDVHLIAGCLILPLDPLQTNRPRAPDLIFSVDQCSFDALVQTELVNDVLNLRGDAAALVFQYDVAALRGFVNVLFGVRQFRVGVT